MSDVASYELVLRYSILALPVLGLLVLLFLLHSRVQQRHEARDQDSPGAKERPGNAPHSIASAAPLAPGTSTGATSGLKLYGGETVEQLEDRLAGAEQMGQPIALAMIYLALGRARMANGEMSAGLDAMRSAAGLAAMHKHPELHAECRLDLAEAAYEAGDPITACEHWQMARMAFLEAGMRSEGDKIDRRMRANGCPTDWVLTDF